MMGGGKPMSDTPANPAAAQTDDTTTLAHLAAETTYTVSGTLNSGPSDGVVQITLSDNGLTVPVSGASNNEGHLLRASDGYPQAFSFTFESPADVTDLQLRILSATGGWDITHSVTGPPSNEPPPVDNSKPTVQGQPPTSVPLVYEAGQTTATPAEDLETYRTFEPDPAFDPEPTEEEPNPLDGATIAANYEIGWAGYVATALQSHGAGQASADWADGEEFYWNSIETNASEPLKTAAAENKVFWTAVKVRAVDPNFIPPAPWNSESFLSAVYDWGWYGAVMANRPEGQNIVGVSTWHSNKNAYSSTEWP